MLRLLLFLPGLLYLGTLLTWTKKGTVKITGDEPHYVIIAESLLRGHDLDLRDDYDRDHRTSRIIGPVDEENHTVDAGGALRSVHSFGMPLLVLPGYALGHIRGARLTLVLLAASCVFAFYWIAVQLGLSRGWATGLAVVVGLSLPFPMAAGQIFPDLPTGVLTVWVVALLLRLREGRGVAAVTAVACALLLGALPWLHIKNHVAWGILSFALLLQLWRRGASLRLRAAVALVASVPVLALAVLQTVLSGSPLGPFGVSGPSAAKAAGLSTVRPDWAHLFAVANGLLFDRTQGVFFQNLLFWFPASVGWAIAVRREGVSGVHAAVFAVVAGTLLLNASHPCSYGCLALPGRFQWSVAPLFFLPLAVAWRTLFDKHARLGVLVLLLAMLYQLAISGWFDGPSRLYHVPEPSPYARANFVSPSLNPYLPSWNDVTRSWRWPVNWIWWGVFSTPVLVWVGRNVRRGA